METKINIIWYRETATGYHGVIAGRHHGASIPEELLDRAWLQFPHLLFKLQKVT